MVTLTRSDGMTYRLLNPGRTAAGDLFIELNVADGRLSITGVEGPKANGDARGSSGQCMDTLREIITFAPGWNRTMVNRLYDIWDEWHLNDMQAGSPAQTAYLKTAYDPGSPGDYYTWAVTVLEQAGLHPDPNYLHNGKPYHYGHAWLTVEVPQAVIDELSALPESTKKLPGSWGDR